MTMKWDERERQERLKRRRTDQQVERAEEDRSIIPIRRHKHGEAFALMVYQCTGKPDYSKPFKDARPTVEQPPCGHRETFWNSRDGVTPFGMGCPSCGGHLQHLNWSADRYAPDHVPHYGQGVWRDGTPDEAEAIMRRRCEMTKGTPYECDPGYVEALVAKVRSGEVQEFQAGWPMFERRMSL